MSLLQQVLPSSIVIFFFILHPSYSWLKSVALTISAPLPSRFASFPMGRSGLPFHAPFDVLVSNVTNFDSLLYMTPNILPKTDAANRKTMKNGEIYNFVFFSKGLFFFSSFVCLLSSFTCLFFSLPRLIFCNFLSFFAILYFLLASLVHSCFGFYTTVFPALRFWFAYILYIKRTAQHRSPFTSLSITAQNFYKPKITFDLLFLSLFLFLFCSISLSLRF